MYVLKFTLTDTNEDLAVELKKQLSNDCDINIVKSVGLLGSTEIIVAIVAAAPGIITTIARPCLKIGGMPDWGRFFCQARRFDAGILTDFKSNQRSPGGKRCPKTAFCHFSNKA